MTSESPISHPRSLTLGPVVITSCVNYLVRLCPYLYVRYILSLFS